jgi:hypothetical protein
MIEGSCHCGAVRWSFDGVPDAATACNCTVCRRYGVLWAYDYENEGIRVSGPTHAYARVPGTLNFIFVRIAAASPIGVPARPARTIAGVSPLTFDSRNLRLWAPSSWITSTGWTVGKICRATVDVSRICGSSVCCRRQSWCR